MHPRVILGVVSGPLEGRLFEFDRHDTFLFGRSKTCHAHLPNDQFVSRHHFILEANPPDARLRDLGSLNGTYVNGTKYGGRAPGETREDSAGRRYPEVDLKHGDRITVGHTRILVKTELPAGPRGGATVAEPPRCEQCGKDASTEVHSGHRGEYLCHQCRSTALAETGGLRRLMQEAVRRNSRSTDLAIDGYDIGDELGRGGAGVVYRATRKSDAEQVAVKIMLARVAVRDHLRRRFLREIETVRQLNHPHLVRFFESGSAGSTFYFVMQYCDGGSLKDLMNRHGGRLPLSVALPIMRQCLDGLDYAHRASFVHRDLKPQNVLLDNRTGQAVAKLTDFGLAKSFDQAGLSGMTATGTFGGTCHFMPREQLTHFKYARPVSDVWSIAATFYNMITGRFPRDTPGQSDPIEVVLNKAAVPICRRDPSISKGLAVVLDRALLTDPSKRYQTAGEMKAALHKALL